MNAVAHSLTSQKGMQLNGKPCRIEGYDPDSMRYCCKFDESDLSIKLKGINLSTANEGIGSNVYEIVPIIGKGLGVIATKHIERLTPVIVEKPILESPFQSKQHDLDPDDILTKIQGLSTEQQKSVLELSNCEPDPNYDDDVACLQHHIRGIIETNVFGGKVDETERSMGGIALCLQISRLNHSCSPNCEWRWNAAVDALPCVYALRDIEVGEELTLSYVLPTASRSDRRNELRRYRFTCNCEACKSIAQDAAREHIEQTMISRTNDVGVLLQALEHMREINLPVPKYEARINKQLCECYMRTGEKQKALEAAEQAAPVLEVIFGPGSVVARDLRMSLRKLRE